MFKFIRNLILNTLSTLIGFFTTFVIIAILLVAGLTYFGAEKPTFISDNSVLVIDLNAYITDTPSHTTPSQIIQNALEEDYIKSYHLLELLNAVNSAAKDDLISCIFLHGNIITQNYASGFPVLREFRQALEQFKESGKKVYAYMVDPSIRDYFLMSVADHLYLNPLGTLDIKGFASEGTFFANAFDKYGIGVQITRVGKYKSAVEPFVANEMSPESREQLTLLLDQMWDNIAESIATSRNLPTDLFKKIGNANPMLLAHDAKSAHLIDEIMYFDSVLDELEQIAGKDESSCSFEQIDISAYIRNQHIEKLKLQPKSDDIIAVIYAEGDITNGEGYPYQIGGDSLAKSLREYRQNENVKAVVLRINSPGGSATASEVIQREVQLLSESKTVIVSMSSMAASGGYWISTFSDAIVADPISITGSIGVFGILFNLEKIANNFGITWDSVKTSQFADIHTISRPKTDAELALIQKSTDFIYDLFLDKVSKSRNLDLEMIKEIAQGRVWSGEEAFKLGLVDQLGGLQDAIQLAANKANLGDAWTLIEVPRKKRIAEAISEIIEDGHCKPLAQNNPLLKEIKSVQDSIYSLSHFNDPHHIYARFPYFLDFK